VAVVLVRPSEVRFDPLAYHEALKCHAGYPIAYPKTGPDAFNI
jgi:hypothetical protein